MISVIIPAHNEEKYVARCISSIREAERLLSGPVEIVVVCNRCTDATASAAEACGAVAVLDESKSIAAVRNAGIAAAHGEIIVTIDADNRMTPGTLREIEQRLASRKYIGGGAPIRFERYSFPLRLNDWMVRAGTALTGYYSGIFWAEKETFDDVGGFTELKAMEDVATAKKLKAYGKSKGKKYGCLKENHLINSTRKYDDLGDWLYFRLMFKAVRVGRKGRERMYDELFYEYNDKPHGK